MDSDTKPDYELDAYMRYPEGGQLLCDVKIWLPQDPATDGAMQVVAFGLDDPSLHRDGLVSFVSTESTEAAGLHLEAIDVLVRQSHLSAGRRAGGATLTISHVSTLRIETYSISDKKSAPEKCHLNGLQFVLSELAYGCPQHSSSVDFRGNRTVHSRTPYALRMALENGRAIEFELDRHWTWSRASKTRVSATSAPVLSLRPLPPDCKASLEMLTRAADDACALLTLAARHRVVVHRIESQWDNSLLTEWRNPLARTRGHAEEGACGPVIDAKEIELYFLQASSFWSGIDSEKKDAISLAIFSIHSIHKESASSQFLAMFYALEGLAKRWGQTSGKLQKKVEALLRQYPAHVYGAWPLFDNDNGPGLYWLRNELAHGEYTRGVMPSALTLANDHLQLWLENLLLAIIGYRPGLHPWDWLSGHVSDPHSRSQVIEMQRNLKKMVDSRKAGKI